uniref:Tripartite motif-containing protein 16-like n=1 Tax=Sinocyclocheilus grahami TaxID=75366 RepID=A0A672KS58_SINGR
MTEARFSQDELVCAVCLDLPKEPVSIQCGHSYCMNCITDFWDLEDQKRVYSCPQCRQSFSQRPALAKNTMLAEVVEKLKKTKLSADCYAGAGDVQCDVCTGRKYKAVRSCLMCLNSYCQNHLEQHERTRSAQTAVEESERICTELIRSIERSRSEVTQMIRDQEKTAVSRAEGRLERLEQEINDLRRRDAELEQLSHTQDHIQFLQSNSVITYTYTEQPYPDHPDRFDVFQVLCRESVCGRCYWEIEWSGSVLISVSYKSLSTKGLGNESVFGYNDQSWSLSCSPSRCSFIHNNIVTKLPAVSSSRIGVFVDLSAGTLSFYSVSDTMSLIHTVQTAFTQTLYPGFLVDYGSSVKLC